MNRSIRTSRSPRTNHIYSLERDRPKHVSNFHPANIHFNSYWETAPTTRSFLPWSQIKLRSGSGRTRLDSDQSRALADFRHFLDWPDRLFRATSVHPLSQKYFCSRLTQITFTSIAVLSHRGAARDRHERGTGGGGSGERLWRGRILADGEVVWS